MSIITLDPARDESACYVKARAGSEAVELVWPIEVAGDTSVRLTESGLLEQRKGLCGLTVRLNGTP